MVVTSITYFLAVSLLLGLSGVAGPAVQVPDLDQTKHGKEQSFGEAVVECLFTLFTDCDQRTESAFFTSLSNAIVFAVNFIGFFFQLLTFQLPIPAFLNAIIVLPGATGLAYVGIRAARGGG